MEPILVEKPQVRGMWKKTKVLTAIDFPVFQPNCVRINGQKGQFSVRESLLSKGW